MAAEHLDNLGISARQAGNAVTFFESYANTVLAETESLDRRRESNRDAFLSLQVGDPQWFLTADAASSLREAAQWAMLIDMPRGRQLLSRAGRLFQRMGHGFGWFLLASSGTVDYEHDMFELRRYAEVLEELHRPGTHPNFTEIPAAMHHPQQQAYLLVSLSAIPPIADQYHELLRDVCEQSPHRRSGLPVGALGLPIRHYWSIATSLVEGDATRFLSDHLVPFTDRYAENVTSAMSNDYLWTHGGAPVDVADIDTIGITALAIRRFGRRDVLAGDGTEAGFRQFGMGRALLEMGDELANGLGQ
jgi:hypothetical protein